jgi:hypothetical protein
LFNAEIKFGCPISESTKVYVKIPTNGQYELISKPQVNDGIVARYDVGNAGITDIGVKWKRQDINKGND